MLHPLSQPTQLRNRWWYAFWTGLVITTGLLWRSRWMVLPVFAKKYGGDALWALMVFLGFGFLFNRWSTTRAAVAAGLFSCAIEFLKLVQAPWLKELRQTQFGALVFGSVFNGPNLTAYAGGILAGVLIERLHRQGTPRQGRQSPLAGLAK